MFVFCFAELRSYANEKLEVDAGHRTRQYRQIFLVEQVVHRQFQLQVHGPERQSFFKRDIAHEIPGQMPGDGIVVTRHGETLRVIAPLVEETPCTPRQAAGK